MMGGGSGSTSLLGAGAKNGGTFLLGVNHCIGIIRR